MALLISFGSLRSVTVKPRNVLESEVTWIRRDPNRGVDGIGGKG